MRARTPEPGSLSLRLDAAYCLLTGLGLACCAGWLAAPVRVPAGVLLAAGVATAVWGSGIAWMAARIPRRRTLRIVLAVNVLASIGVAAFSASTAGLLLTLAVLAFAIDIAAFAVSQALALRRLGSV